MNGSLQYSENPQIKVLRVTKAFGLEVAVISIKIFLVSSEILEYSELDR